MSKILIIEDEEAIADLGEGLSGIKRFPGRDLQYRRCRTKDCFRGRI